MAFLKQQFLCLTVLPSTSQKKKRIERIFSHFLYLRIMRAILMILYKTQYVFRSELLNCTISGGTLSLVWEELLGVGLIP